MLLQTRSVHNYLLYLLAPKILYLIRIRFIRTTNKEFVVACWNKVTDTTKILKEIHTEMQVRCMNMCLQNNRTTYCPFLILPFPSVKSRKPSLGDLILRHTNSPTRARNAAQLALAHVRDGGQSLHSALFRGGAGGGGGASGLEKQAEALRVKNAVYSAVIFCEFLKELAALAQEHAVTLPFASGQGPEE